MALKVKTSDPAGLLDSIRTAIDKERIRTWAYDKDGNFTHTTAQWKDKALLKPKIDGNYLLFNMGPIDGKPIEPNTYGMYSSAFIQTLLDHLSDKFESATVTAKFQNSKLTPRTLQRTK